MRVEKLDLADFEWEENCIAKVFIEEEAGTIAGVSKQKKDKKFVIKSRWCQACTKLGQYYCQKNKNWEY